MSNQADSLDLSRPRLRAILAVILASTALAHFNAPSAEAGFLANSADMAASRALGASMTGVPNGQGGGGLLGINFNNGGGFGSATYINPYYVITAAHGTWGLEPSTLGITVGSNVMADPIVSRVESITYFPTYPGTTGDFFTPDIAILKLSTPLQTDYVQQIGGIVAGERLTGTGFGQFGASDLGDSREFTGEASAWYGRAALNGGSVNTSDIYYNRAAMLVGFGATTGRGDVGDSGGGWYNSNHVLVGMSVAATLNNEPVGTTWILDLTNPEVAQFLRANTIMTAAVPEPSSLLMLGVGIVAGVAAVRRNARVLRCRS